MFFCVVGTNNGTVIAAMQLQEKEKKSRKLQSFIYKCGKRQMRVAREVAVDWLSAESKQSKGYAPTAVHPAFEEHVKEPLLIMFTQICAFILIYSIYSY